MLQKLVLGLVVAGLTAVAAADTVYKWADSRGQIHYSDLPPTQAGARILGVFEETTESSSEGEDEGEQGGETEGGGNDGTPATTPAGEEPAEPPAPNETVAAVQADVAKARSTQCKEAQDRYKLYVESRRLFRQTADGKRQYLSDQELAEARVRAKQSVDEFCS